MVDKSKTSNQDLEQIKKDLLLTAENLKKASKEVSKFADDIKKVLEHKSKSELYEPNQSRKASNKKPEQEVQQAPTKGLRK